MWGLWWVWVALALGLAILEVLLPVFVFLGFALGAGVTGLILLIGGGPALWMAASLPRLLVVFAVISVVAWILLRWAVGVRKGQIKVWDRDINED